ncbi:hypothetical protein JR316_0009558 [Psilocybe cubensis]|uniref:Uncharacterized protein n=1 Tax=Psilocybe cubensis TaxID=181762 RepID=A0ACB8GPL6_PSICU|nr:hypothetical protein JR316_0009558 [Psilocybe cubensis]KAH9477352.1 hypothetical protein JR316_0009558 [Psilocybe cubensis]
MDAADSGTQTDIPDGPMTNRGLDAATLRTSFSAFPATVSPTYIPNLASQNIYTDSSNHQIPLSAERRPESVYGPSLGNLKIRAAIDMAVELLLDFIPRKIYLYLLLRLPAVYFSRVAAIFEESALTLPEIKQMTLQSSFGNQGLQQAPQFQAFNISHRFEKLDYTWNSFVDSLLRDWNTYNIVSALILSAILTILQIDTAAKDPLIRYTLLFSQVCAITSLLLGCLYSIRFDSSMRKTYKAAEWADEAQKFKINIWWNIWVLLAMPAIWLAWSTIFYIVAIMAFVWRTDTSGTSTPAPLSPHALLLVRILITLVLTLGFISGWLSLMTFRRYGHTMDRAWRNRVSSLAYSRNQLHTGTRFGNTTSEINDLQLPQSLQRGNNNDHEDPNHRIISHPPANRPPNLQHPSVPADEGDRRYSNSQSHLADVVVGVT